MPLAAPATTQPDMYLEAFLQYTDASGDTQSIVFDAVLTEDWDGGATVTEHPVEEGANIADHVRVTLPTVTLKVRATNEPLDSNQFDDPVGGAGAMGNLQLQVPKPNVSKDSGVRTFTVWDNELATSVAVGVFAGIASDAAAQATGAIVDGTPIGNLIAREMKPTLVVTDAGNEVLSYPESVDLTIGGTVIRSASDAVGAAVFEGITSLVPQAEETTVEVQVDAGLPSQDGVPTTVTAQMVKFQGNRDYAREMIELLWRLKDAAQLFTVYGSKQTGTTMVIEKLSPHRGATEETGTGAEITIGLKKIRIVSTNTVAVPLPSIPRAQTPQNRGAQDPTPANPADMKSFFLKVLEGGVSLFGGKSGQ